MQLFYHPEVSSKEFYLSEEDARHAVKVLRYTVGSTIMITDGKGSIYECQVKEAHPKKCMVQVIKQDFQERPDHYIHIAIAPTKNIDRIEWFVEKAIEFGVDHITFLITANSERSVIKQERIEKKAISAMKQCLRPWMPEITPSVALKDWLQNYDMDGYQRFIAHVDETIPTHLKDAAKKQESYLVLIGPEGDFAPKEIDKAIASGFKPVSLGKSRLRTETAGIASVHILNLINE